MHYYGFEGSVYIGNYAESHANEQSNTNILLIEVKYSTNRSLSKWLGSSCHTNLLCVSVHPLREGAPNIRLHTQDSSILPESLNLNLKL